MQLRAASLSGTTLKFVHLTFQVYVTGFDNTVALMGHLAQNINVTGNKGTSLIRQDIEGKGHSSSHISEPAGEP